MSKHDAPGPGNFQGSWGGYNPTLTKGTGYGGRPTLAEVLEAQNIKEFQQQKLWVFDPVEFGFKIDRKHTKKGKGYYEALKIQQVQGAFYACKIVRLVESEDDPGFFSDKEYRFTLSEYIKVAYNRADVELTYTIPTADIGRVILTDSNNLATWFNAVCTEPLLDEAKNIALERVQLDDVLKVLQKELQESVMRPKPSWEEFKEKAKALKPQPKKLGAPPDYPKISEEEREFWNTKVKIDWTK